MAEQFEEPPYICFYCTTEHRYASAMFACEDACAADRGRE